MTLDFPLLICSSVAVNAAKTKLIDPARRIDLVVKGVNEWLTIKPNLPIVICDGSDFDFDPVLQKHGLDSDSNIELIRFVNDTRRVSECGKGFGEGQIVDRALNNSALISQAGGFIKCTSRLWVENFHSCMRFFNGKAGFDYQGRHQPTLIDTRFYAVRVSFYDRYLRDAHEEVDEKRGLNLEHVFQRRLLPLPPSDYLFRVAPLIYGVSGSMGTEYRPSRSRNVVRSLRNSFVCATGIFP